MTLLQAVMHRRTTGFAAIERVREVVHAAAVQDEWECRRDAVRSSREAACPATRQYPGYRRHLRRDPSSSFDADLSRGVPA